MSIATIASVVAAIAAVLALFPKVREWLLKRFPPAEPQLQISRVQSADDPDLLPALSLYSKRIPENEQDSEEDILRWLIEVEAETKEGRCKLKDYFLIGKIDSRVTGLLYGQYYPERSLAFLSYLVIDDKLSDAQHANTSTKILGYLLEQLRMEGCGGIVFELEYSGSERLKKRQECRARMRRFRTLGLKNGVAVKEIGITYKQPKLSLWEEGLQEERQHLMYAKIEPPPLGKVINKNEVERILRFLYEAIYGDQFEDDRNKDTEFRIYLNGLYQEAVSRIGSDVPLC